MLLSPARLLPPRIHLTSLLSLPLSLSLLLPWMHTVPMLSFLVICSLLSLVAAEQCDDNGAKTLPEMSECLSAINDATYRDDKRLAFSNTCMMLGPRGFSDSQLVSIIEAFTYSDDKTAVLAEMGVLALGINCTQAVSILGAYTYASDKKSALSDSILPLLTDVETQSESERVREQLPASLLSRVELLLQSTNLAPLASFSSHAHYRILADC